MKDQIENAKNEFLRAKGALLHSLATTPDDRLTWSPSPTSRSPLQQAGHAAEAVAFLQNIFDGQAYTVPPAEADRGFREHEKGFTDRDEVVRLVESRSDAYVNWLDALDAEKFDSTPMMPFGIGEVPMQLAITFPAFHLRHHQAQLDYIQTIYGDHDWHL